MKVHACITTCTTQPDPFDQYPILISIQPVISPVIDDKQAGFADKYEFDLKLPEQKSCPFTADLAEEEPDNPFDAADLLLKQTPPGRPIPKPHTPL